MARVIDLETRVPERQADGEMLKGLEPIILYIRMAGNTRFERNCQTRISRMQASRKEKRARCNLNISGSLDSIKMCLGELLSEGIVSFRCRSSCP